MQDIFSKVDKSGEGVCVQASTQGSLEALLAFLDSDDVAIPVSGAAARLGLSMALQHTGYRHGLVL